MVDKSKIQEHMALIQGHTVFFVDDEEEPEVLQQRAERPNPMRELGMYMPQTLRTGHNFGRFWLLTSEEVIVLVAERLREHSVREHDVFLSNEIEDRARPVTFPRLLGRQWTVPDRPMASPFISIKQSYSIPRQNFERHLGTTTTDPDGEQWWNCIVTGHDVIYVYRPNFGWDSARRININRRLNYRVAPIYVNQNVYLDIEQWMHFLRRNAVTTEQIWNTNVNRIRDFIANYEPREWANRLPEERAQRPAEFLLSPLTAKGNYDQVVRTMRGKILKDEWL